MKRPNHSQLVCNIVPCSQIELNPHLTDRGGSSARLSVIRCLLQSTLTSVNKISMNLKQVFASISLVAGTAIVFATAPAQAAKLTASDLGLPTLSANAPIGSGANSTTSAFPYRANTFTPAKELRVKFSLNLTGLGSRGMGLSSFGYTTTGQPGFSSIFSETTAYDKGSSAKGNDWLGTCNKAITGVCEVTVDFKAGKTYQLGLLSKGISHYAVAALDKFTFDTSSDQYYQNGTVPGMKNPFTTVSAPGQMFIGLEDGEYRKSGNNYYYDYQDWVVKAEAVPEPATLAGLGLVAGGLLTARRRKANQSA